MSVVAQTWVCVPPPKHGCAQPCIWSLEMYLQSLPMLPGSTLVRMLGVCEAMVQELCLVAPHVRAPAPLLVQYSTIL